MTISCIVKRVFGSGILSMVLCLLSFLYSQLLYSQPERTKRFDNYVESINLFTSSKPYKKGNSSQPGYKIDYHDKINGDFSIEIDNAKAKTPEVINFKTTLWNNYFPLDENSIFKMYVKVQSETSRKKEESWNFIFLDSEGNQATAQLEVKLSGQ